MRCEDDGNESNELSGNSFEDDVDVDEDALANDMTLGNIPTIVISDRHAVILATIEKLEWQPPYAHHRLCLRHLLNNFNRVMGNIQLKKFFG